MSGAGGEHLGRRVAEQGRAGALVGVVLAMLLVAVGPLGRVDPASPAPRSRVDHRELAGVVLPRASQRHDDHLADRLAPIPPAVLAADSWLPILLVVGLVSIGLEARCGWGRPRTASTRGPPRTS